MTVKQLRLVVHAEDYEGALRFFRDALGMPEQEAYAGDGGAEVTILDAGRATLEGFKGFAAGGAVITGIMTVRTRVHGNLNIVRSLDPGREPVRRAIEAPVLQMVELARAVLDVCPPELAGDVLERGVTLTGGGALLRGLAERMHHELGVPVTVADDPLRAVARGAGRCVEEFDTLHRVLVDNRRP